MDEQRIALIDELTADEDLDLHVRILLRDSLNNDSGFVVRRVLPNGQVLGVTVQIFNAKLTVSESMDAGTWLQAW